MGAENNEVVIATTWNLEAIEEIKEWINGFHNVHKSLFVIVPSLVNSKQTIILAPDGSKKGWPTAEAGKNMRNQFILKLETFNYEDGSNPFKYVEVGYGDFGQKVLRGNCKNMYSDDEYYQE